MAWFQKPGTDACRIKPKQGPFFRHGDVIALLGAEPVFLYKDDEVVVARHDFQNQSLGKNDLCTAMSNQLIYGPAFVAELQELEP